MAEQSYQSHAHHPIPTYIAAVFSLIALVLIVGQMRWGWDTANWTMLALLLTGMTLNSMSRWYIVKLQDRIIMLEMKVRAAEILTPGQDALLAKLGPKQIVALRFAADDELGALLERAARENLSPKDIKASIRTWRPDLHRT
jgi:hypothetical protein